MNCLRCGRPLTAYAASVKTRDGMVGWGPKCAKTVQILPRSDRKLHAPRVEIAYRAQPQRHDPLQPDLFEAAA